MRTIRTLVPLGCALAVFSGVSQLRATTVTGTFSADNSFYTTTLVLPTAESLTAFTTSYAGGMNLDGTTQAGGGFVPDITIFSVATGNAVAFSPTGMCGGKAGADSVTGLCNDAYLSTTLSAGSYALYLTEFPNVALGGIDDGFLAGADKFFTGTNCTGSGQFLEADVAPCVQRTDAYALNIAASAVPEPAPVWLAAGLLLMAGLLRRNRETAAK